MAEQKKRIVAYDQEYPGTYAWPIYEVLCPECGYFVKDYGSVSQTDQNGYEHYLCIDCGDKVFPFGEE